ncbi:MAG TPA: uroporphyrinogen-III synthase, partial [Terracidiphilus sp.]|nr:uroporphyrinogen-III synthase [Terracidiphilus sp.]
LLVENGFMAQPLLNRRILVTRGAAQASKLSDGLRALGALPIEVPVIEIAPPASFEPLDDALRNLAHYDWLLVTSANTVRILAERGRLGDTDFPKSVRAQEPQVAAVGTATAETVEELLHAQVAVTPKEYVAESLVAELKDRMIGKRVLLARAAVARDVIPDALRAAGATVDVVDAYRNVLPATAPQQLRHAFARGIDAVTFASSSSATHLAEAAQAAALPFPFPYVPAISIGPVTSETLRACGWPPAAEADPHDIPGLIAAVRSHFFPSQK